MNDEGRHHLQFGHSCPSPDVFRPLPLDEFSSASLLQKAIRRSDTEAALRAALTLHRWRGKRVWRRLIIIAVEDVGIGCPAAAIRTICMATDTALQEQHGDLPLLFDAVQMLVEAVKNRETDLLLSAACHHPNLECLRDEMVGLPVACRIELATDPNSALWTKAVATWLASGVVSGGDYSFRSDYLKPLLSAFEERGVRGPVLHATWLAGKATREPICVVLPLLTLEATSPETTAAVLPASRVVRDVPLYAFDKHTRLGLAAIAGLVRENADLRKVLAAAVPKPRWRAAVAMAAFYVDAVPLSRGLTWARSTEIERLGMEADFAKVGVPPEAVTALFDCVSANLDHLNDLRERLFVEQLGGAA